MKNVILQIRSCISYLPHVESEKSKNVSSTYVIIWPSILVLQTLLIYNIKRIGPRTFPCGISQTTLFFSPSIPFMLINCNLFSR
jgi:hypothetical protein